jgi:predicted DNA-binding transcriptional regulator AlpA
MTSGKSARKKSEQKKSSTDASKEDRVEMDQLLTTADIVRTTGRHRCTIYRWIRAGVFPPKRGGGGKGWLKSDVDRWLARGM